MTTRPAVDFSVPQAQPFLFEGDNHGVLLIHGFTGSVAHMRLLGEHLRDQGFTVMGINLPGHAQSMEAMGKTGWQDWLRAAKEGVMRLREICQYVSVSGLSMGGVLTLMLAEQMDLTAAAPISAPMGVQNRWMPLAGVAWPFVRTIEWTADPERAHMLDSRYDLGYTGFPTRCAADLNYLIKQTRRDLHAVVCPVLAVQSHADETIAPASADIIMSGVSSRKKRTLWLDEVPHVCTISQEHGRIAEHVGAWLRAAEKDAQKEE